MCICGALREDFGLVFSHKCFLNPYFSFTRSNYFSEGIVDGTYKRVQFITLPNYWLHVYRNIFDNFQLWTFQELTRKGIRR